MKTKKKKFIGLYISVNHIPIGIANEVGVVVFFFINSIVMNDSDVFVKTYCQFDIIKFLEVKIKIYLFFRQQQQQKSRSAVTAFNEFVLNILIFYLRL